VSIYKLTFILYKNGNKKDFFMRVVMVGTGYVGLVSGTCFAEFGHDVVCVDIDESKIKKLEQGEIPIYEPNLDILVQKNIKAGRLTFTTNLKQAVEGAKAVFIAVGTPPSRRGDGHADLQYVFEAAKQIAENITDYTVVITKSTVPVGTGQQVEDLMHKIKLKIEFDVVSNPEFLREGAAIEDFMRPDRVVVGTHSEKAKDIMRDLYRPLFINETPLLFTGRETAEMIKYAANAFLATKITFINEIADLCEKVGANVQDVAKGIGLDKRIGGKFLHAGPGYGGSCFPKDTKALIQTAKDFESPLKIVEAVEDINNNRKKAMAQRIIEICDNNVKGKKIAVLGVTFKPNTDDMREAPSLDIIPILQKEGASIFAYDPEGQKNASTMLENVNWCKEPYDTMDNADILVIITEWNQFRALDMQRVKSLLKTPLIADLRNIYAKADLEKQGFSYYGIGLGEVKKLTNNVQSSYSFERKYG
jgi:UDPglucose 6-dehydrogenase